MSDFPSIAVAQSSPVRGDVEANVREHIELATRAADLGANVVLFPELSLTGYELDLASALAFDEHDPRLAPLLRLSEQLAMTLVVGAPFRRRSSLHIGAFGVAPDGHVVAYAKRRLGAFPESARVDGDPPPPERQFFSPGDSDTIVESGSARMALSICADVGDPEHPRRAAVGGSDAYLASSFIIPSDFDRDSARLAGYGREHSMLVAMANFGTDSGGLASAGRSSIWNREGRLVGQLPARGSGVLVAAPGGASARSAMLGG